MRGDPLPRMQVTASGKKHKDHVVILFFCDCWLRVLLEHPNTSSYIIDTMGWPTSTS